MASAAWNGRLISPEQSCAMLSDNPTLAKDSTLIYIEGLRIMERSITPFGTELMGLEGGVTAALQLLSRGSSKIS